MGGGNQRRVNGRASFSTEQRGFVIGRVIFLLLLAVMLLTGSMLKGCGYKGPLYLPDTAKQPTADKESKKKSKQQN